MRVRRHVWIIFTAVALILLVLAPIATYILIYQISIPRQTTLLNLGEILAASGWIQAVVAWITLGVALFAALQIYLFWQQNLLQQDIADRELYRRLVTPEMQSTRRCLALM